MRNLILEGEQSGTQAEIKDKCDGIKHLSAVRGDTLIFAVAGTRFLAPTIKIVLRRGTYAI